MTVPVLSLLLVFRTNSAYQRWDEARRMWGSTVNRSRDICRMALTHLDRPELRGAFLRWLKAFVWCYKMHMR
jgi:ion channel-forming bestrophin family protein